MTTESNIDIHQTLVELLSVHSEIIRIATSWENKRDEPFFQIQNINNIDRDIKNVLVRLLKTYRELLQVVKSGDDQGTVPELSADIVAMIDALED